MFDLAERIPPVLYRYVGVSGDRLEWLKRLLTKSGLFFARPSSLNDPYDCRIEPRFTASSMEIENFWRQRMQREGQNLKANKQLIRRFVADSRTPQGRERLRETLFQALERHGVACCSTTSQSVQMWTYYGEGHSGVVVRFNTALDNIIRIPRTCFPVEVQYTDSYPEIGYYDADTYSMIATLLGTKGGGWSHEREWRLVLVGENGHMRMPTGMIDGVILGLRTSQSIEELVREWITEAEGPIELLRAVKRPNSFDLAIEKV